MRLQYCSRSSHPEVFLGKGVMKICDRFTGEYPCRSVISITLQSNTIEIALQHGCSALNLLHIFRTPFPRNTSGWLLLLHALVMNVFIYLLLLQKFFSRISITAEILNTPQGKVIFIIPVRKTLEEGRQIQISKKKKDVLFCFQRLKTDYRKSVFYYRSNRGSK